MKPMLLAAGAAVLLMGSSAAADAVRDKGLAAIEAWEAGRPEDAITLFQEAIGVIQGGTEAGLSRALPDRAGEYVGGEVESASGTWGSGAKSVPWISATRRYEVPGTGRRVAVTLSTSPELVRAQRAKLATYDDPETLATMNTAPGRKVELVAESGFRGWTTVEAGKEAHMTAVGEKLLMTIDVPDGDAAALAAFRAAIPLSRLVRLDGR
ncbi:MAG: hypothetical protein ACRDGR_07605 [bacterium]